MKYEIRRERKIEDGSGGSMTLNEPAWFIYFEGRKFVGPFQRSFSTVERAFKFLLNGIGTEEGIIKINIETQKE